MKRLLFFSFLLVFKTASSNDSSRVKLLHPESVSLFSLKDIRLLPGEFKHIQDLDHKYLLSLEPDRMASWFRREAGLTPKAPPYPFWESENVWGKGPLAGHIMGFYLSSMSMMFAATGDQAIIDKLTYTLNELDECQRAGGDGYLLAVPNGRHIFEDVADGQFTTSNPLINDSWEPVYIMNKIMLGLNGVYNRCNLPLAKQILIRMADWFGTAVLDKLNHEQIQQLLVCEHGSINESFVDVYSLTNEKKYLDWAGKLNDEDMWVPASQKKDVLEGWHANTQIPKFTGFERLYDYTGDTKFTNAAQFFWKTVVDKHTWANGGNSTGEHFFARDEFPKRVTLDGGPESCNSVNMLRLTEALYRDYGEVEKIDYYEQVLYNHILANYDPEQAMCTYYTSMRPGHYRVYGTPYNTFWCCTGTGFESPAKFGQMIYAHDQRDLFVNMFIPSKVNWTDQGLTITQQTKYPDENSSTLQISALKPRLFSIKLRYPYWANDFHILVNGKPIKPEAANGYMAVKRKWKNGDSITVHFVPKFFVDPLILSQDYLSVKYGAIVLGAKVDNHGLTKNDFQSEREAVAVHEIPLTESPSLYGTLEDIGKNIQRLKSDRLEFLVAEKKGQAFNLVPFNRIHFSRYTIYFPWYRTHNDLQNAIYQYSPPVKLKAGLSNKIVDSVKPGNSLSEQQHKSENLNSSSETQMGNSWREASDGGYFMYRMQLSDSKKLSLYCNFAPLGQDGQAFDIFLDGKLFISVDPSYKGKNELLMPLPKTISASEKFVTVKFISRRHNKIPKLYDLYVVNQL